MTDTRAEAEIERLRAEIGGLQSELGALSAERHKLAAFFDASPVPLAFIRGPELVFESVNAAYEATFTRRDVRGKALIEAFPEVRGHAIVGVLNRVFETGEPFVARDVAVPLARHPGEPLEPRFFDVTLVRIDDLDGKPHGIYSHSLDTTARKRAQEGLERNHQQLHDFFMQSPIPMVIFEGPEHRFTLANPPYERFVGRHVLGKTVREAFTEEEVGYYVPLLDSVYQTGRPFTGTELSVNLPDREGVIQTHSIDVDYHPFRDQDGRIKGVLVLVVDVTEKVAARRRIEASARELATEKRKLEVMVKESPVAIGLMRGPEYVFEIANENWRKLLSDREYLGRRYEDIYPELVNTPAFQSLKETFLTGEPYTAREMKLLVRSRSGQLEDQYFDYTNIQIQDGEGRPYGVFCHALNVTERVLARSELERTQQRIVDILERMNDAFLAVDANWTITRVNARHEEVSRVRREDQLGRNFHELFFSDEEARATQYWRKYNEAMAERVPQHFEDHYAPLDVWTAVSVYPQADGGLAIFYRYITDQKKSEAALRSAIEARDVFLGIASHELKTPLTSLKLQAEINQRLFEKRGASAFDAERLQKLIANPIVQAERLTRLVDDMLDVSRIASGKLSMNAAQCDLSELVRDTLGRLAPQLEAVGCSLTMELAADTLALVDAFRLEQVVTNLITNVAKYAPGRPVLVSLEKLPDRAILRVRDHGPGVPVEQQPRLFVRFERFVSASKVSGLGLGLHISKEIVEAHGGTIEVASVVGRGTEFIVELPRDGTGRAHA